MAKSSKKTATTQNKATKKKTNTKKSSAKKTMAKSLKIKKDKVAVKASKENTKTENTGISLRSDITLVVSLALMIIMTISNFGVCGPVGNGMSYLFFGIFGCVQYIMPLAIFAGVAILIANDYNFLSIKKCAAAFVLLMMVSAFAQILYQGENVSVTDLMSLAIKNHATGGIIGGSFGLAMKACFGTIGAVIILFFVSVFAGIVLTQRSLAEFFKIVLAKVKMMLEESRKQRVLVSSEPEEAFEEEALYAEKPENADKVKELEQHERNPFHKLKQKIKHKKQVEEKIQREQDCDQVLKDLEETEIFVSRDPLDEIDEININMPTFVAADAGGNKESIQELEENVYPLSMDDLEEPVIHEETKEAVHIIEAENIPEESVGEISEEARQLLKTADMSANFLEEKRVDKNASRKSKQTISKKVKKAKKKDYIFPPLSLLESTEQQLPPEYEKNLKDTAKLLQQTLASFGVNVKITDISCGPTVTRYEMFPEQGTKVSKIVNLADDIKLNLAAADIRIEAPIPGKAAIGIEVPNPESTTVHFKDIIDNRTFKNYKSKLAFAVGKDIAGKTIVTDIAKMPHLLIAGATGSGKSVCINTLIMSILYKSSPEDVKMIMIDPKMVELSVYNGIPHLLIPVVTDPKKASGALNWAVTEMTKRYQQFAEYQVRNIEGYNQKISDLEKMGEIEKGSMERMPKIVIIVDELADLMMVAPGEVEDAIVRLSQLARAAGIHLVIATQRPSVNVITGLIKANVPSRIAFSVASNVDSRTIIDMNGAEKLLGRGDMLFYPSGYQKPVRMQGAFVSDEEVMKVVDFLKNNEDVAVYSTDITQTIENSMKTKSIAEDRDEYFEAAARIFIERDKAAIGTLQRVLKVGFNRGARIVEQLEAAGIVGPDEGTKPRKVLMSEEQFEQYLEEYM